MATEKKVAYITESMFDSMMHGKPFLINGIYISIRENSELKFIDIIEQKLVKEYGLDVEEKEK